MKMVEDVNFVGSKMLKILEDKLRTPSKFSLVLRMINFS